jgi:hypothetical protein
MIARVFTVGTFALALCAVPNTAAARPAPDQIRVPLSDPARPATLNLELFDGRIIVRGASRQDILVDVRVRPLPNQPGGLRQLTQAPAFSIDEERNNVAIKTDHRTMDVEIQVPARANLKLTLNQGEIVVEGVEGELEIQNENGPITLNNVGGAIVANSTNHHVKATITSLAVQKPTAFSSLNGHVDVTFPASLKANLKLRSDKGSVFTDFDLTPLAVPTAPQPNVRAAGSRVRIEVNRPAVYGAVNGGGPEVELRTFNGDVYVRRGQ